MGTDMTMLYECKTRSGKWRSIKEDSYLERDYNMFYALIGKAGYGDPLFPPITHPKGFPGDMSAEWANDEELKYLIEYEKSKEGYDCVSYVTLKELVDSRFYRKTNFKGWIDEEFYEKWIESNRSYNLFAEPIDTPEYDRRGLVLHEIYGYPNVTLVERIIEPMKQMKQEFEIISDNDIRMIFWLG